MTIYKGRNVIKLRENGESHIFKLTEKYHYVSLGDSIAVGHAIDDNWETDYGYHTQYGSNGNQSTLIVPNSYTDLIRQELSNMNKGKIIVATSFSHSGDTTSDLLEKLNHDGVIKAIKKASLVTICIGANDVLEPALSHIDEYINTGDLSTLATIIDGNMANLNNDSSTTSYKALLNRLNTINPNAKYVFTTIYNPYKYLWIEDGHYGFFQPLLQSIPSIEILGFDIDSLIKDSLLGTSIVQQLFDRVNGLNAWVENYVTQLNNIIKNKVNGYGSSNFMVADTKALFDVFPDRPITAPKHYNDLVNVEYTRNYDTAKMDWGRLWENSNATTFWTNLASKYVSWSGIDINGFAEELVELIINRVVIADIDPHPETYGHYVLKRSFADVLGWQSLDRYSISFNANGGSGTMANQIVIGVDGLTSYANIKPLGYTHPTKGYRYISWNNQENGNGTTYSDRQFIGINSNITLYAQWSNIYTLTFRHSEDSNYHGSSDTGVQECYALWIDGTEQGDLGVFSNPPRTYQLAYGTAYGVIVQTDKGDGRSYILLNGNKIAGNSSDARYTLTLTGDTDVHYIWNYWLSGITPQAYWTCEIATY